MKIQKFEGGSYAKNNPNAASLPAKAMFRYKYIGKGTRNLSVVGLINPGDEFELDEVTGASLMLNDPVNYLALEAAVVEMPVPKMGKAVRVL